MCVLAWARRRRGQSNWAGETTVGFIFIRRVSLPSPPATLHLRLLLVFDLRTSSPCLPVGLVGRSRQEVEVK